MAQFREEIDSGAERMLERFIKTQKEELDWFKKSINQFRDDHKSKIEQNMKTMKNKLEAVSSDMGKGLYSEIDEIQKKVQHLKEVDEKEKNATMQKLNKQKAEIAVKEEEFNAQKQLVTQRYLKLQEQAEKYQSEKE